MAWGAKIKINKNKNVRPVSSQSPQKQSGDFQKQSISGDRHSPERRLSPGKAVALWGLAGHLGGVRDRLGRSETGVGRNDSQPVWSCVWAESRGPLECEGQGVLGHAVARHEIGRSFWDKWL